MIRTKFRPIRLLPELPGHIGAVEFICNNLRPEDRFEFAAVALDPAQAPHMLDHLVRGGEAYIIVHGIDPVFAWGVQQTVPGVYHVWGFGTPATRRVMPALTRWGMREWLPDFIRREKPRRIEVRVPIESAHSTKWLQMLGLKVEATMPNYGVNGEDFFQLAMTLTKEISANVWKPVQGPESSTGPAADHHSAGADPASPAAPSTGTHG